VDLADGVAFQFTRTSFEGLLVCLHSMRLIELISAHVTFDELGQHVVFVAVAKRPGRIGVFGLSPRQGLKVVLIS